MRSPFTGVAFALQLTHRWDALLPLLIGASAAYAVSVLLLRRSILTEKIARRGHHLSREYDVDPLEIHFVGEVMQTDAVTFEVGVTAADALRMLSGHEPDSVTARRQMLYPVVTDTGRMTGVVTRTQVETAAHHGDTGTTVGHLARRDPVTAHEDEKPAHRRHPHGRAGRRPVTRRRQAAPGSRTRRRLHPCCSPPAATTSPRPTPPNEYCTSHGPHVRGVPDRVTRAQFARRTAKAPTGSGIHLG